MRPRFDGGGRHVAARLFNEPHHDAGARPEHDGVEVERRAQRDVSRQETAQGRPHHLPDAQRCGVHSKRSASRLGVGQIGHQRLLGWRGGAKANCLGGPEAGARNLVAGNRGDGVDLRSAENQVQGNLIGTDLTGTQPLPNQGDGILLRSRNNVVGGVASGAGNRVAFNRGDGVRASAEAGPGNAIFANAIFGNRGLGINLQPAGEPPHTVTPNDPLDADTGPNDLQNFPLLTNAAFSGVMVMVRGTLNTKPDRSVSIDFYANTRTEPSGPAEGELYLGFTTCNTDSQGRGSFLFTVSGMVSNQSITATATDLDTGDTSEFSAAAGGVRLVSLERSGADLKLSFTTWPGLNHRLEYATTLGSSVVWNAVPGAANVAGTGGVVTRTDSGASPGTRFYRVQLVP